MSDKRIPITSACLNITDACNFNCRYCFVHQAPNNMSFQVADDACQWLLKNTETPSIFFFGGEPTLRWDDIIVPIVQKYPNFKYSITTNGFVLDKQKIDFLADNDFSVMLSMDGNKETQEYNRSINSFEKLDSIIPYLLEKIPNVNFRGTIIPATCKNTFENICYAFNKGFISCYFTINIFEKWNEEDRLALEEEIKKFTLAYINSFVNDKNFIHLSPFDNMIELLIKNELNILDNTVNIYKCGLGNGYGAIDYKGDIYTCQEIVTYRENNHQFKIGNIYSGMNYDALDHLSNSIVNDLPVVNDSEECGNCPLKFCCKKNTCQVNNFICNNHCLIQSENQCWWNKLLHKYASLSISILQNHPNFQKHMENIILEKEG